MVGRTRRDRRLIVYAGVLASGLASTPVGGYRPEYGPFVPGQRPAQFSLSECPVLEELGPAVVVGRRVMSYGRKRTGGPRLHAIAADFLQGIEVGVVDVRGRPLAGPSWVSEHPVTSRPTSTWCGDLNGDGLVDFAMPLASGGNGLGGEFHDLVVVLSSRAAYRTWVIPTMTPGAEDFLALPDRGHCAIVKTTYVSNEEQSESRRHSYRVYNLIAVRGDELVVANPLYAGFPKWIWYTGRPNHRPTRLSAIEKDRIWNLHRASMFREAPPNREARPPVPRS
jgi:hypothetical protein